MAEPELEPVRVGGFIAAYRPKSTVKKAAKKTAAKPASKAEEAKS